MTKSKANERKRSQKRNTAAVRYETVILAIKRLLRGLRSRGQKRKNAGGQGFVPSAAPSLCREKGTTRKKEFGDVHREFRNERIIRCCRDDRGICPTRIECQSKLPHAQSKEEHVGHTLDHDRGEEQTSDKVPEENCSQSFVRCSIVRRVSSVSSVIASTTRIVH